MGLGYLGREDSLYNLREVNRHLHKRGALGGPLSSARGAPYHLREPEGLDDLNGEPRNNTPHHLLLLQLHVKQQQAGFDEGLSDFLSSVPGVYEHPQELQLLLLPADCEVPNGLGGPLLESIHKREVVRCRGGPLLLRICSLGVGLLEAPQQLEGPLLGHAQQPQGPRPQQQNTWGCMQRQQ